MDKLTGEYECKVDSKGRLRLPATLIKQIHEIELGFTLNRGFEKHLIMYPKKVWDLKEASRSHPIFLSWGNTVKA